MKLVDILEKYDTTLLDQIASDKVDETITLRLPQPVIIQEIISALSSQSYISGKVLYGRPPVYAILNLILQSQESMLDVDGFREKVLQYVQQLTAKADQIGYSKEKNQQLYTKILRKAWENDNLIDKSEALILEVVRQELEIWEQEHFTLMHSQSVLGLWNMESEFFHARNQLLSTGILLAVHNKYVIADEVAIQIRRTFGVELKDESYKRLLHGLGKDDLVTVLSYCKLNVSGSKDAMVERLINRLVPPTDLLNTIHLENLREFCRRTNITTVGAKNIVVANIIEHFDLGRDLENLKPEVPIEAITPQPEPQAWQKMSSNISLP